MPSGMILINNISIHNITITITNIIVINIHIIVINITIIITKLQRKNRRTARDSCFLYKVPECCQCPLGATPTGTSSIIMTNSARTSARNTGISACTGACLGYVTMPEVALKG